MAEDGDHDADLGRFSDDEEDVVANEIEEDIIEDENEDDDGTEHVSQRLLN